MADEGITDPDHVDEDYSRSSIRDELSKMTFEELQKLKETLGSKVYNEAMFGRKPIKEQNFKRANKNRPREVSSKIPVKTFGDIIPIKKKVVRDPRFDSLCGTYNERIFKKSYSFLNELKSQEKEQLKNELDTETNPKRKHQIKLLIQRIENQEREETRRKQKLELEEQEKQENHKLLQEGKQPHYKTKQEKKVADLVRRYKDLKESGKLVKQIEKKRKKQGRSLKNVH